MQSSFILTCRPESMDLALNELRNGTLIPGSEGIGVPGKLLSTLSPGLLHYELDTPREAAIRSLRTLDPIFIRHLHPVDLTLETDSEEALQDSLRTLLQPLSPGSSLALQISTADNASEPAEIAEHFEHALEDLGFAVDPQATDTIFSITAASDVCYAGLSSADDNLSPWPGGRSRYRRQEDQLSRAGFKLEEAIATYLDGQTKGGSALDLGAAPGSWTQVLLTKGYEVLAIDPADLDSQLLKNPAVTHFKGKSEDWAADRQNKIESDRTPGFDLIVNDMKMDVILSARIMSECAEFLNPGAHMIMTFKLPAKKPSAKIKAGLEILSASYTSLRARQLYHNRSEITVAGVKRN